MYCTVSMLTFLVAMTYVFFHHTDTVTTSILSVLLVFLTLVVTLVMMMECAANSPKDSMRQQLCALIVQKLLIASWI